MKYWQVLNSLLVQMRDHSKWKENRGKGKGVNGEESTAYVPAVKLISLSSNMKHQKIVNLKKIQTFAEFCVSRNTEQQSMVQSQYYDKEN